MAIRGESKRNALRTLARQENSTVMLSAAKHLDAHPDRPFATLRACPERSEWGDKRGHPMQRRVISAPLPSRPRPLEILDLCLRLMHIRG